MTPYEDYKSRMQKIADLKTASAVLQWDQETYLPPKGAAFRGQAISTLSEMSHQLGTEESLGNLLKDLSGNDELPDEEKRNVQRSLEDFEKSKKYSSSFVRALSEQVNKTFHSWLVARKKNGAASRRA